MEIDMEKIRLAARWVREAPAILITAGAGMGADSGLPDFRGPQGWWTTFPVFTELNWDFHDIASPSAFQTHPELAKKFFAFLLEEYRAVIPHQGFHILRRWGERAAEGYRVFTSNVDGEFQKAGFDPDKILECHGSMHQLQCMKPCCGEIWNADAFQPEFDPINKDLLTAWPTCPHCGGPARPHVLLFNDKGWLCEPVYLKWVAWHNWAMSHQHGLLVIELGAGEAIPTVRDFGERYYAHRFIRINTNDADVPEKQGWMGLKGRALEVLTRIDEELHKTGT